MVNRINKKLITFQFPFSMDEIGKLLPAGDYTVETEEESIAGLSFLAFRHIETVLVERPPKGKSAAARYWSVDHESLERAIEADAERFLKSSGDLANAEKTSEASESD